MERDTTRRRLLSGVAVAAVGSVAGCSSLTPFVGRRVEETETFSLGDTERFEVETTVGDLSVRNGESEEVEVSVVKRASSVRADLTDLELRADRSDGRLRLWSEWTGEDGLLSGEPAMDLDVSLPRSVAVERVRTDSGNVEVDDVDGDLTATTTNGNVEVGDVDGDLTATTTNGNVDVDGVSGTTTAESTNGNVHVRGVDAVRNVTTTNGNVEAEIRVLDGDATVESVNGNVEAWIAPELDAELRAQSSQGTVSVEGLDLGDVTRTDDLVTGILGDGGPLLSIETTNGNVTVSALD